MGEVSIEGVNNAPFAEQIVSCFIEQPDALLGMWGLALALRGIATEIRRDADAQMAEHPDIGAEEVGSVMAMQMVMSMLGEVMDIGTSLIPPDNQEEVVRRLERTVAMPEVRVVVEVERDV